MADSTALMTLTLCAGAVLLVGAHVLAYMPLFFGSREFVNWDDPSNFEETHGWKGLTMQHIKWDFSAQQCALPRICTASLCACVWCTMHAGLRA